MLSRRTFFRTALSAFLAAIGLDAVAGYYVLYNPYDPSTDIAIAGQRELCGTAGLSCSETSLGSLRLTWSRNIVPPRFPDFAHCVSYSGTGIPSMRRVFSSDGTPFMALWQYVFSFNCSLGDPDGSVSFVPWVRLLGQWRQLDDDYFRGATYSGVYVLYGHADTWDGTSLGDALTLPDELRFCFPGENPAANTCPPAGSPGPGEGQSLVTLTVTKLGSGQGRVTSVPQAMDCGGTCVIAFSLNMSVELRATPASGSTFGGWSQDCSGSQGSATVLMTGNKTCAATFHLQSSPPAATPPGSPTIRGATPGNGSITVAFSPPTTDGGSPILDYTVTCGSRSATGTASPITVSGLTNGTAYTCTVRARNSAGTGISSVPSASVTPTGTTTPPASTPQCTLRAEPSRISRGQSSVLTATCTPAATSFQWTNASFASSRSSGTVWPGATTTYSVRGSNAAGPGNVASATVTVIETARQPVVLTVAVAGRGSVTSEPPGIQCGYVPSGTTATCSARFPANSAVRLWSRGLARPKTTLAGWSGDCVGGSNMTITMDRSRTCTAQFLEAPHNYLTNGDFSHGATGWIQQFSETQAAAVSTSFVTSDISGLNAFVRLGGRAGRYLLSRNVTVPMGHSRLQFWYEAKAGDNSGPWPGIDQLTVSMHGPSGTRTLAWLTPPTGGWVVSPPFDTSPFAGQAVRLDFEAEIPFRGGFADVGEFKLDYITLTATQVEPAPNYTGLWWNPAESGWGINLTHQGDVIFATLFTYDRAGAPLWVVMPNGRKLPGGESFRGVLYRTTGPAFNASPFTPLGASQVASVGTMTITFSGRNAATLTYGLDGSTVTKSIQSQVFGVRPSTCAVSATLGPASNYTGLWWNSSESGWGLNLTHQNDRMFATLFTYDSRGRPMWLVAPALDRIESRGIYKGDLYRTTGPAFDARPFNPIGAANLRRVGSLWISHRTDAMRLFEPLLLGYTVDGVQVGKEVTRQLFDARVPVCAS